MKTFLLILPILSIFMFSAVARGQDTASTKLESIRVAVSISVDDVAVKNAVMSYVSRELRDLKDVKIVEASDLPMIRLGIVVIKSSTIGGRDTGYILSATATRTRLGYQIENGKQTYPIYDDLVMHFLTTGAMDSLKALCEEVATQLDAEALIPIRKEFVIK